MATTVLQSPQEKTFYGQNHKTENNLHQQITTLTATEEEYHGAKKRPVTLY